MKAIVSIAMLPLLLAGIVFWLCYRFFMAGRPVVDAWLSEQ